MRNETLILRDSNGTYYQLDKSILDAARVPEDRVAELEDALSAEVTGYSAFDARRFEVLGPVLDLPHTGIPKFTRHHIPHGDGGWEGHHNDTPGF